MEQQMISMMEKQMDIQNEILQEMKLQANSLTTHDSIGCVTRERMMFDKCGMKCLRNKVVNE